MYQATASATLPSRSSARARRSAGIVLAAVLGQLVDDVGVASDQGGERPAGADRPQLVVVADQHQLGAGGLDAGGEGDQVGVLGHADLVEDDHGALVEGEPVVVEAPQQAGQRPGLAHLRLSAQGAGRLPGGGGADHPAARGLEGRRHHLRAGWSCRRRPHPRSARRPAPSRRCSRRPAAVRRRGRRRWFPPPT